MVSTFEISANIMAPLARSSESSGEKDERYCSSGSSVLWFRFRSYVDCQDMNGYLYLKPVLPKELPNIITAHFLSMKWSKKLFTINHHYELQNGKCIATQELSAYKRMARIQCITFVKKNSRKNYKHSFFC